ncbi:FATC domain protein, partial [Teladorsagia circumcincta]
VYKHKFSCAPMSLEGQVAKLIDIASDEKNLAQMYIGWGPFI